MKDRSITQPIAKSCNIISPSRRWDLWNETVTYTAVRGPTRFVSIVLGEPGRDRHAFRDARERVSIEETLEERFEPRVLPTTPTVKALPSDRLPGPG